MGRIVNEELDKAKTFTALIKNLGATGAYDSKDWFTAGWSAAREFSKTTDLSLAAKVASYLNESSSIHRSTKLLEIQKHLRTLGVRV
jgi:hypothetical protein